MRLCTVPLLSQNSLCGFSKQPPRTIRLLTTPSHWSNRMKALTHRLAAWSMASVVNPSNHPSIPSGQAGSHITLACLAQTRVCAHLIGPQLHIVILDFNRWPALKWHLSTTVFECHLQLHNLDRTLLNPLVCVREINLKSCILIIMTEIIQALLGFEPRLVTVEASHALWIQIQIQIQMGICRARLTNCPGR